MARRIAALVTLAVFMVSPAAGFDTYWHSQCTQKTGESAGFSEDAWKIVQLGNFSADLFGPLAEYASKNPHDPALQALSDYQAKNQ